MMGHKDWTMIARIYVRWMPSADSSAGSQAVQKFSMPGAVGHSELILRGTALDGK